MITLRKANEEDARFIALCFMEAIGDTIMERIDSETVSDYDQERLEHFSKLVLNPNTLYYWQHAVIAISDEGTRLGTSISYPGEQYKTRRAKTFELAKDYLDFDPSLMEDEACAGEHYLDTLAVLPQFRGQGVAKSLLKEWIARATEQGLVAVLACNPSNEKAHRLYEKVGLRDAGMLFIFGDDYIRMARE